MSKIPKPKEEELRSLLEGKGIYHVVYGITRSPTEKIKRPFAGYFELDANKHDIDGFMLNPLSNESLISRLRGKQTEEFLEFIASDELFPENITRFRFQKIGQLWTKDGNIYVWRGDYRHLDDWGDASCKTTSILLDTNPLRGQYGILQE